MNNEKRLLLIKFHENICEQCKKKFKDSQLQIHKLNPSLGYSNHRNLKVVCSICHDLYSSADRKARGIQ